MRRRLFSFFLILVLCIFFGSCDPGAKIIGEGEFVPGANLSIYFLDVGQGDSIILSTPNGKTMLIDAGEAYGASVIKDTMHSLGLSGIDVVVATHPHSDHIGGMAEVIQDFPVGSVYMPKAAHTTKTYELLLETIKAKGLTIHTAKAGVEIPLDPAITVKILSPIDHEYDELNNYSAVIKITYGANSFLLMGDAEVLVEEELVASGQDLSADVIKIGHHGSDTSTSSKFLDAVHPADAVISVGEGNSYNHPSQTVLSRLEDNDISIHRTDLDGTIVAVADGNQISFREFNPQQAPNAPPDSAQEQNDLAAVYYKNRTKISSGNLFCFEKQQNPHRTI